MEVAGNEIQPKSAVSKQAFEVTEITGENGPWQKRISVYIFLLQMITSIQGFALSFLAPNVDHWCARPSEARNLSVEQWRNIAMPPDDPHCSRYADINFTSPNRTIFSGNTTIPCHSWEYDTTIYRSTALSQFDLVCDRKWLVSMTKSVFIAGGALKIFLGHVSDWFGRRPMIIASGIIAICAGTGAAFSTSFTLFVIFRFLTGIGATMNTSTPFVYMMEISGPKCRNMYGMTVPLGYTLGMILLPMLAWFIADLFWIQIAIVLPCFLNLAAYWLPESPRWLLNHGEIEKAENVLFRAAEVNGVNISEDQKTALRKRMTEKTETCKVGKEKANVCDLLKTPGLRMITLIIFFTWSVNGVVYHGLSQNTNELAGNPFVNFALYGVVEIPAYIFVLCTIEKLGKRNLISWSMFISGTACFVTYLLPSNPWWLSTAFSIMGKLFITISYSLVFVYASELFPTVARNIGMVSASVCGRVLVLIAPFMRELGNATHLIVPQIVMGAFAISSGLLVFLLPDTRKFIMPDTLEEAEQFIQNNKNSKKNIN